MGKRKDPFEGLEDRLEGFLTAREKKMALAKDPKARFEAAMERLERFLDAADEGSDDQSKKGSSRRSEGNEDDRGFIESIFGSQRD